ncbi:MAG: hypothetical protein P1U89_16240 [Verrucomicrobiales bacterium]|nr:hypothetical protein [Verrucomicrobiales bacterium]
MKIFIVLLITSYSIGFAFDGKVIEPGQKPNDRRLGKPVTLHDYHPFRPVASAAEWDQRKSEIRTRVKVASGILPELDKTPMNPVVSERAEKDGFAIQKVYFESIPGHYVTGTLYSPAGDSVAIGEKSGKRPVVLCPHGHWRDGRFYRAAESAALGQIAQGGERFLNAAYNPIVARCVQLARMGCLVLQYDMLGNADSLQLEEHRRGPREITNGQEAGKWGFVSPQSVLRLQTNFGLQTWNSVRALDFMLELPGADPERVLVTGASGGATQTMILAAVDDRVDASFPCVMASTAMQGGCTCENSYYLRIGQGNMDIAAVLAPKPLGLTAADDWTRELQTKGHPDLVNLYRMLKAPKKYDAHFDIHFKHNYNHVSRTHMYQFVNTHFGLGLKRPVLERDYAYLSPEELTVWVDDKMPDNYSKGIEHERDLNRIWAEDGQRKVAGAFRDKEFDDFRKGWEVIIDRDLSELSEVSFELLKKEKYTGFIALGGVIRNPDAGQELPALFYYPDDWNGIVKLMPTASGKSGLFVGKPESPTDEVKGALDDGVAIVGVDLFKQSEFLDPGEPSANDSVTYSGKPDLEPDSWQRSPVYFYGYNHSVFVNRVHDLLTTIKMIQTSPDWEVKGIEMKGEGPFAALIHAANLFSNGAVKQVEADLKGFTFESLNDSFDQHFVPGAVRFGDVAMLAKLSDLAGK